MSDVVYMVRAKSEASCQRELDLICERMGAVPVTSPTDAAGRDWVARAVPARTTKAPTAEDGGRGPGVSG
jgi:hypothetical protein